MSDVITQSVVTGDETLASAIGRFPRGIPPSPLLAFASLSLLYVVTFFSLSYLKLLWLDELITLHIARLSSVAAIWQALAAGADPNPPVTHILVHAMRSMFGEYEWALRLPSMMGYWLGMLFLFLYLRRRVPPTWALAGTVLSMTMAAFDYSFESRSYALFYGFAIISFYCWTMAVDATNSLRVQYLALGGMVLALAAGISTNYFAVLAFLPIAGGELTFTIHRVRIRNLYVAGYTEPLRSSLDSRVWLALLLAATPLLAYRSMIAHSITQFAPHAWNKVSLDQVSDSYTQMVEIMLFPLLGLFVVAGIAHMLSLLCLESGNRSTPRWLTGIIEQQRIVDPLLPPHERVGVFLLMAYPLLGYLMASIRGGMLSPRFVIPVCFGFAISGSLTAYRLFSHLPRAGATLLAFCLVWFIARESVVGYWYAEQKQCFYKVLDRIPLAHAYLPGARDLVVPDPLMVLTLQHYAPASIADRIVFPIDFPAIRKFRRDDSAEQNIWAGRSTLYSLQVLPLAKFQQRSSRYLVLASDGNWLLQDLDRHHYPQQRLPINTRAAAIGGFTPLFHGVPVFYIATGGETAMGPLVPEDLPIPFKVSANLPSAPDMQ